MRLETFGWQKKEYLFNKINSTDESIVDYLMVKNKFVKEIKI